jgi:hypothetical protein
MTLSPKKSVFPPARVGLLVIISGVVLYGVITLIR